MDEIKKRGRPTMCPKTTKLQVRIDDKTLRDLDKCAFEMGTTRSDVVRVGIQLVKEALKEESPQTIIHACGKASNAEVHFINDKEKVLKKT